MQLTKTQARRFLLAHQGLRPPHRLEGKAGILEFIRRVGCIQFDPLNIAGHNQELVLQSRVADFRPRMLAELLYADRRLLDGFDKVMSIYSVEDWPYFRRWRESHRDSSSHYAGLVRPVLDEVRAEIEARGPLSSLELERDELITWDWGTRSRLARAALDWLYLQGELVIHHRVHTRKVYDLAHRCLPAELVDAPDPNLTDEEYHDWHVLRRIGSVGLLWNRSAEVWLGIHQLKAPQRTAAFNRLLEKGLVEQARVEGIAEPFYFRSQDRSLLERSLEEDPPPQAAILAPLDNLVWDRRMLSQLFGFDYRWEVYVPADKRRYGYYVLPVLYGERFVARFEPLRDKKRAVLLIKNWWWEDGVTPDEQLRAALSACLLRFSDFLSLERIELSDQAREQIG